MRKVLAVMALALLAIGSGCPSMSTGGKQKVVYHINYNDETQLAAALGNVQNHIAAVGKDSVDIKVVMHGNGVCKAPCCFALLPFSPSPRFTLESTHNCPGVSPTRNFSVQHFITRSQSLRCY